MYTCNWNLINKSATPTTIKLSTVWHGNVYMNISRNTKTSCQGNALHIMVLRDSPPKVPVMQSVGVFFTWCHPEQLLKKQRSCWWFEAPWSPCDVTLMNMIGPGHTLQWRHDEREGVSNHRRYDSLLNRLFRRRSKKSLKLRVTGLCEGNPPVTGGFPSQRASNAVNVSIWWRHHKLLVRVKQTFVSRSGMLYNFV